MDKFEGRLLKVGSINSQGVKFSEDCKIDFSETVPIVWNYHADEIPLTRAFATIACCNGRRNKCGGMEWEYIN